MSMSMNIYLGPYLAINKVKIPSERKEITCPNTKCEFYGRYMNSKFCDGCGNRIAQVTVPIEIDFDYYDMMEVEFGNGDLLSRPYMDKDDFDFLIANSGGQGGLHIDHQDENEIPITTETLPSGGDWDKVCKALDDRKMTYQKRYGLLTWYS